MKENYSFEVGGIKIEADLYPYHYGSLIAISKPVLSEDDLKEILSKINTERERIKKEGDNICPICEFPKKGKDSNGNFCICKMYGL